MVRCDFPAAPKTLALPPTFYNWATDTSCFDLAGMMHLGRPLFFGRNEQHINRAEGMVVLLVAVGWRRRAHRANVLVALISLVTYLKEVSLVWIPTIEPCRQVHKNAAGQTDYHTFGMLPPHFCLRVQMSSRLIEMTSPEL